MGKIVSGEEFIQVFESYCPQWLAEEGDPVGLHIGTLNKPIHRVMMTLDVRPEVVEEAIEKNIDLLIAKHPPIFKPVARLTTDDPQEKMYADLLKHDIAVYAAHTNMDIIADGLNDWFCEMLDITVDDYLVKTHTIQYKKLAVYLPREDAVPMRKALATAGAGMQGEYEATSFTSIGQGRFTPMNTANPTIGTPNVATQVEEAKVEVIFPETIEQDVLKAMYAAHPYEEPAFDLYTIEYPTKEFGLGRIGHLAEPIDFETFVSRVKITFELDGLRIVQPQTPVQMVEKIAICGGSGGKFYPAVAAKHADVYITGDIYYHTAHDMQSLGLAAIDPGHHIEVVCIDKFIEKFNGWKEAHDWEITFYPSETNTNPFQFR